MVSSTSRAEICREKTVFTNTLTNIAIVHLDSSTWDGWTLTTQAGILSVFKKAWYSLVLPSFRCSQTHHRGTHTYVHITQTFNMKVFLLLNDKVLHMYEL